MQERRKNQPGRGERRRADAYRIADALKRRGRVSLHVQGDGMMPFVQPGDVALIRRDKLENMRSGDVVLLQRGNHLIAQRIGEGEDLEKQRKSRGCFRGRVSSRNAWGRLCACSVKRKRSI